MNLFGSHILSEIFKKRAEQLTFEGEEFDSPNVPNVSKKEVDEHLRSEVPKIYSKDFKDLVNQNFNEQFDFAIDIDGRMPLINKEDVLLPDISNFATPQDFFSYIESNFEKEKSKYIENHLKKYEEFVQQVSSLPEEIKEKINLEQVKESILASAEISFDRIIFNDFKKNYSSFYKSYYELYRKYILISSIYPSNDEIKSVSSKIFAEDSIDKLINNVSEFLDLQFKKKTCEKIYDYNLEINKRLHSISKLSKIALSDGAPEIKALSLRYLHLNTLIENYITLYSNIITISSQKIKDKLKTKLHERIKDFEDQNIIIEDYFISKLRDSIWKKQMPLINDESFEINEFVSLIDKACKALSDTVFEETMGHIGHYYTKIYKDENFAKQLNNISDYYINELKEKSDFYSEKFRDIYYLLKDRFKSQKLKNINELLDIIDHLINDTGFYSDLESNILFFKLKEDLAKINKSIDLKFIKGDKKLNDVFFKFSFLHAVSYHDNFDKRFYNVGVSDLKKFGIKINLDEDVSSFIERNGEEILSKTKDWVISMMQSDLVETAKQEKNKVLSIFLEILQQSIIDNPEYEEKVNSIKECNNLIGKKFTPRDLAQDMSSYTGIPFDLSLKVILLFFKEGHSIDEIANISSQESIKILYLLVKKQSQNNFNDSLFLTLLKSDFYKTIQGDIIFILRDNIDYSGFTIDDLTRDPQKAIDKSKMVSSLIHNNSKFTDDSDIESILKNPITRHIDSNTIKTLTELNIKIKNFEGVNSFCKLFFQQIKKLKYKNVISKDFEKDLEWAVGFFNSKESQRLTRVKSSEYPELASKIKKLNSSIDIIINFTVYEANYEKAIKNKKIPELYKLNMKIGNKFRFRVLEDLDYEHFTVGAETNCCQRIGGAGEDAAIDSFINPTAGVVIFEINNNGNWEIVSQSYFHYVSKDNGFILDNVEASPKYLDSGIFSKSGEKIPLEAFYSYWAQNKKNELNLSYFVSGQSYSKINIEDFESARVKDNRHFETQDRYTDFSEYSSIDLLRPKFGDSYNYLIESN